MPPGRRDNSQQSGKKEDVVPMPKPRGAHCYMPISLTSCIGKIAERIILNHLLSWMEPFHHNVYGFTKGVLAVHYVATILGLVCSQPGNMVLLNLEKTIELTRNSAILASLSAKGIQGRILTWIVDYIKDRVFGGPLFSYHRMQNGTPQGETLVPTFLNVFMENLALLDLADDVRFYCYAGDLELVVTGGCCLLRRDQGALNLLPHECEMLGLKMLTAKTESMSLRTQEQHPHLSL
ncbi:uncharacterized protein LOC143027376 [Oratosquilla oratoria]|uniref:uncharacterized protein LOC143027376 n=1 Tax=Oratosquilla oratoria TaxID=337810 RepID=UPI003F76D720